MSSTKNNVILIGMPGAGKSTIGMLLAKKLRRNFVDSDVLIELQEKQPLQAIVNIQGHKILRLIEENVLCNINGCNQVLATGGSAVYSERAMRHLKQLGPIVYLEVPLSALLRRISNMDTRGIAKRPDQSFEQLFSERQILYREYADIVINCEDKPIERILNDIIIHTKISSLFR